MPTSSTQQMDTTVSETRNENTRVLNLPLFANSQSTAQAPFQMFRNIVTGQSLIPSQLQLSMASISANTSTTTTTTTTNTTSTFMRDVLLKSSTKIKKNKPIINDH